MENGIIIYAEPVTGQFEMISVNQLFVVLCLFSCCLSGTTGAWGQPFNFTLDFESGSLYGWYKTGSAFDFQPTLDDNPSARHRGQPSRHQGKFWIGTYERYQGRKGQKPGDIQGDGPRGRLTSPPFVIRHDHVKFLIGGGAGYGTRVELLVMDPIEQTYVPRKRASGQNSETMHPVTWNISDFRGRRAKLQIVDDSSGVWGHINVDDFRFYGNAPQPNPSVKLRIIPEVLRVRRGETAVFRGGAAVHSGHALPLRWTGPGGQQAQGPVFRINTSHLSPGTYRISLRTANPYYSTAYVPAEARASLTVLPTAVEYGFGLRVQPVMVQERERVQFAAVLQPASPEARYRFIFGDGGDTGWITGSRVSHLYRQPGEYTAAAYVRPGNDKLLQSKNVLVKVVPRSYRLNLRADRSSAKTGEALTFYSSLVPEASGAGYRCFWGDGKSSTILDNPRMVHRYEHEGQFQVLCEAYIGERAVKSNTVRIFVEKQKYELELSSSPAQVFTGERVLFTAGLRPLNPEIEYLFVFGDDNEKENGRLPQAEHVYSRPGTYFAQVRAVLNGQTAAESGRLKVVVSIRQPAPTARISPERASVEQGMPARFRGRVQPESARDLQLKWSGPRGQGAEGDTFQVDTSSLEPGSYPVSFRVTDRYKRSDRAEAVLVVREPVRFRLNLKAQPSDVLKGQMVEFDALLEPPSPDVTYCFHYGNGESSGWVSSPAVSFRYQKEGSFVSFVEARKEGRIAARSEKVTITVRPQPGPAPNLVIKVDPLTVRPGQEITVTSEAIPSRRDIAFDFVFGDGDDSGKRKWSRQSSARHSYSRPGSYRVRGFARTHDGQVLESREVMITVVEGSPPFPIGPDWKYWAIAILFGVSYGIFRIRKHRKKRPPDSSARPSSVRVKVNRDAGVQKISCEKALKKGPDIRIRPVQDSGKQEIIEDQD